MTPVCEIVSWFCHLVLKNQRNISPSEQLAKAWLWFLLAAAWQSCLLFFYGAFLWNDPDQGLRTMITQLKGTNKPYTVVQIEFRVSFHTPWLKQWFNCRWAKVTFICKFCDLNPKPKPNTLSCIHTCISPRKKTPDPTLLQQKIKPSMT